MAYAFAVLLDGLAFEVDGADGILAGLAQEGYRPVKYAAHERAQFVLVDTLLLGGGAAVVGEQLLGVHRPPSPSLRMSWLNSIGRVVTPLILTMQS